MWRPGADVFLVLLLLLLLSANICDSCSCLPSHPQSYFCKADYVLLVKVKSSKLVESEHSYVYKVKAKRTFKMTDKASLALKSGQIWTAQYDATCGVDLRPNGKYLLAGTIHGNKAFISQCDFHEPWNTLTMKQKKGFKLLYKQGCDCKVQACYWSPHSCRKNHNSCTWDPSPRAIRTCEKHHTVCMRQPNGDCNWLQSRTYKECLKTKEQEHQRHLAMEP